MRRALLALAFSALAGPAFAQEAAAPPPAPPPANPIQALEDCVLGQAQRLEVSREAADIVADAAVAKCGRALTTASLGPNGRPNLEARQQLKEAMRESAATAIVELRADRNTPKPPPPPPPKPRTKKR
ncbi:MAG: hypothetical protein AB7M12_12455 [Hyphomonadaceae bacterium]